MLWVEYVSVDEFFFFFHISFILGTCPNSVVVPRQMHNYIIISPKEPKERKERQIIKKEEEDDAKDT